MPSPLKALRAGFDYLTRNPTELVSAAKHAASMRVAVPLDALRWYVANAPPSKKAPQDVVIGEKPPAITVGATLDLMGTRVRAAAAIAVEELRLGKEELRVTLRLSDVKLEALDPTANTPITALLRSGALDLSKPGNLANFMPKRPKALVEAKDDVVVLDFLRMPKLAENLRLRRMLSVITPVLVIRDLKVERDHLLLSWRPRLGGLVESFGALRA